MGKLFLTLGVLLQCLVMAVGPADVTLLKGNMGIPNI